MSLTNALLESLAPTAPGLSDQVLANEFHAVAAARRAAMPAPDLLAILDSLPDAISIFDLRQRIIIHNRAARELSDTQDAIEPAGALAHPADAKGARAVVYQVMQRVMQGESVDNVELLLPRRDATHEKVLMAAGRPLRGEDGTLWGVVVVCRSAGVQRRAENHLAALVDSAPDAIVIATEAGEIVRANRQAEEMFGFPSQGMLGVAIETLIPQRYRARHVLHRANYLHDPRTRPMGAQMELYGLRADGTEFPVEIALSAVASEEGALVTAIVRDMTERKRVERLIRQANEELEQRVRERTTLLEEANRDLAHRNEENEAFVYSVSHDLRSPLVNLLGFSKELENICQEVREIVAQSGVVSPASERLTTLLQGDAPQAVQYIQTAVSRLSRIVDALLRLSRAGRVDYHWANVDLAKVVASVVDSLSVTIRDRGATVSVGPLPVVKGDAAALEQVFANLIDNALKYSHPQRSAVIEVGCQAESSAALTDGADTQRTLFVKDNGLGIPAAGQSKVFRVFQRFHPGVSAGEGIGLAMLERIVARHRGRVWFESQAGLGTTFFVQLPTESRVGAARPEEFLCSF